METCPISPSSLNPPARPLFARSRTRTTPIVTPTLSKLAVAPNVYRPTFVDSETKISGDGRSVLSLLATLVARHRNGYTAVASTVFLYGGSRNGTPYKFVSFYSFPILRYLSFSNCVAKGKDEGYSVRVSFYTKIRPYSKLPTTIRVCYPLFCEGINEKLCLTRNMLVLWPKLYYMVLLFHKLNFDRRFWNLPDNYFGPLWKRKTADHAVRLFLWGIFLPECHRLPFEWWYSPPPYTVYSLNDKTHKDVCGNC